MLLLATLAATLPWHMRPAVRKYRGGRSIQWFLWDIAEWTVLVLWPSFFAFGLMLFARRWLLGTKPGQQSRGRFTRSFGLWLGLGIALILFELLGLAYMALASRPPRLPHLAEPSADISSVTILALGGSTMYGEPYDKKLSMPALVARQLDRLFPERQFSVDMVAYRGEDLRRQLLRLSRRTVRPDLILLYTGHNELTRNCRPGEEYDSGCWDRWREATPGLRMIHEVVNQAQTAREPASKDRRLWDVPLLSPANFARRYRAFRESLEALLGWCQRERIPIVVMIPASNLLEFDPNRNCPPACWPKTTRNAVESLWHRAEQSDDPDDRYELYRQIDELTPGLAEIEFRLGRLEWQRGNHERSRELSEAAKNHDGAPIRATKPVLQAIGEVAAHYRTPIIDTARVLQEADPDGPLGENWFHDAHHLNLKAMVLLSQKILATLKQNSWLLPSSDWPEIPFVTSREAAKAFGLTFEDWRYIYSTRNYWFQMIAAFRYDGSFRKAKAIQNREWAATPVFP